MLHDGKAIGVVGFSGLGRLDPVNQTSLQLISYNIFATSRAFKKAVSNENKVTLTNRETQVLRLSAEGHTSGQIATAIGISARTVNQYADNAIQKLRAKSRTHAVAEAIRRGLIGGDE